MKTLKKLIFSSLLLTISLSCLSMEKSLTLSPQAQTATTRAIISQKENIFKSLEEDIKQANYIYFDTLVFTNKNVGNALKDAKDNGAHIEGSLGSHWCNKDMQKFFNKNDIAVTENSENHAKLFLLSEKDARLGSPGKNITFVGSANASNNAYHNSEIFTRTENDKSFFIQHLNNHNHSMHNVASSKSIDKKILELTPQKQNLALGSHDNMLSESKALRVQNLINSKNEQRILYISSMNWNSPIMTQELIKAQKSGITIKVILDRSALLGKGKDQLDQMHEAHVPIYIYDPGKNNRTLQHSKVMLRIDGSDYLVINSTANMTPEGDKENNSDSYYPNSEQMSKDIKTELDTLIASNKCKQYTEELATLVKDEKTKKTTELKKRLLFNENETDAIGNNKKSKK